MIGQIVINFDTVAMVIAIFDNGDYLLENPRIGKWRANPMLCTLYKKQEVEG